MGLARLEYLIHLLYWQDVVLFLSRKSMSMSISLKINYLFPIFRVFSGAVSRSRSSTGVYGTGNVWSYALIETGVNTAALKSASLSACPETVSISINTFCIPHCSCFYVHDTVHFLYTCWVRICKGVYAGNASSSSISY